MPQDNNLNSKKTLQEIHDSYDVEERPKRRWPAALAYLWAAFLVAVVVVFGGRWIYRTVNNSDDKQTATASKEAANNTAETNDPIGTEKKSGNSGVIVPASPGQGSVSVPKQAGSTPQQVPDTGDSSDAPNPANLPNTGG